MYQDFLQAVLRAYVEANSTEGATRCEWCFVLGAAENYNFYLLVLSDYSTHSHVTQYAKYLAYIT